MQRLSVVADHIETTAFSGAFRSESADDYMTSALHCSSDLLDVCAAIARVDKKVEDSAIMPDIVGTRL